MDDHEAGAIPGDDARAGAGDPGPRPEDDPAPHPAAAAVNWRTVLVADSSIGVVLLLVGLALLAWWNVVVGAGIASLGFAYLATVWRRGRLWRDWRRRNGLT